jgi:hypothetical protein
VKCRDRGFERGERLCHRGLRNSKDRPGTIAYIHHAVAIECDARRYSQARRIHDGFLSALYAADAALGTIGHKHFAVRAERDPGRIHDLDRHLVEIPIGLETIEAWCDLLTARTGPCENERIIFWVDRGIRNDVHFVREQAADRNL